MKKIKEKLKQLFYDRYFITKDSYVEYEMIPGDIEGTFMFPDISYDSKIRGDAWGPIDHYKRIEEMLVLGGTERLASDTLWREKMLGGLNYWLCHDFINPNWWHNQFGTPNALSGIALMLEDYLTTDMKQLNFTKAYASFVIRRMVYISVSAEEARKFSHGIKSNIFYCIGTQFPIQ